MKKIFKIAISTTLACGIMINTISFAAEVKTSLSLEEAIKVGIENSDMLEITKAGLETAKIGLRQTENAERSFEKLGIRGSSQQEFMMEEGIQSKKAEIGKKTIDMQLESIEKQLELNISKLYYAVLQTKDFLEIEKDNYKNLETNYNIVKKKYELGSASKHDFNMMEIDLNNGKMEVEKAEDTYKETLRALNNALDYPLDTKLELTTGFVPKQMVVNLDNDLKTAYEKRYDYVLANSNVEIARETFRVVQMSYTPNTYAYRLQDEEVKIAELKAKTTRNTIEADIKAKFDKINTSKRQVEMMEANIKKAEEGVRVLNVQYELNMVTMDKVNEALVGLNKAKLGKANAIGEYNTALIDYELAVKIGQI